MVWILNLLKREPFNKSLCYQTSGMGYLQEMEQIIFVN